MSAKLDQVTRDLNLIAEWYRKAPASEVEAAKEAMQEIFHSAEIQTALANMGVMVQRYHDICDLFEKFLKTMDDIMGGGDTVARFRDRYEELTGKKIRILGDPMDDGEA